LKNPEEFRASVYARAEREKERLAARRQKVRNTSLSVAMVLLVAVLAIPVARIMRTDVDPLTVPETVRQSVQSAKRAAPPSRMVLLMATASGERQAVVLDSKDQQKEFVSQYKNAIHMGDDEDLPITPTTDNVRMIHSVEELAEFLAELPEAAGTVTLDYDEAFFLENNLCAMPMDLAVQPGATEEPTTEGEASSSAQMTTIPDGTTIPDETTIPDDEPFTQDIETETEAGEPASTVAAHTLPEGGLLLISDVKVLLLVPVSKG